MSKQFRITSKAGLDMGVYFGDTAEQAVAALNDDAGGESAVDDWYVTELTGPLQIVDTFSHLNDTDAGREAIDEYERAIEAGKDHVEAEIMAGNVLQRAGFNVHGKGGVTIRASE